MDKGKVVGQLNDLVNLITVQILDTLSSLNEGEGRKRDWTYYVLSQKYSFVKKWNPGFVKYCLFLHQSSWPEEGGGG